MFEAGISVGDHLRQLIFRQRAGDERAHHAHRDLLIREASHGAEIVG
jgi:hypothetical protein